MYIYIYIHTSIYIYIHIPQPFIFHAFLTSLFPMILEGLLPIDHLAGLIIFDISVKGGGMASYQVKGLLETWTSIDLGILKNSIISFISCIIDDINISCKKTYTSSKVVSILSKMYTLVWYFGLAGFEFISSVFSNNTVFRLLCVLNRGHHWQPPLGSYTGKCCAVLGTGELPHCHTDWT